ncbi:hypothetical protein F5Y06DRAFT_258331 [Hypoxylon sp. FL0890]|nr:hypothetical protein F5Y06DRAFT_258331 [Hypoxylon sp. FL0890]
MLIRITSATCTLAMLFVPVSRRMPVEACSSMHSNPKVGYAYRLVDLTSFVDRPKHSIAPDRPARRKKTTTARSPTLDRKSLLGRDPGHRMPKASKYRAFSNRIYYSGYWNSRVQREGYARRVGLSIGCIEAQDGGSQNVYTSCRSKLLCSFLKVYELAVSVT